jgi:hypothetical protein
MLTKSVSVIKELLLGFAGYHFWVARINALLQGINQEVQFFQNECADQRRVALWLQVGIENSMTPLKLEKNAFNLVTARRRSVGVGNLDFPSDGHAKLFARAVGSTNRDAPESTTPRTFTRRTFSAAKSPRRTAARSSLFANSTSTLNRPIFFSRVAVMAGSFIHRQRQGCLPRA